MDRLTLPAPAKINLSLDVTGKLENGYHTLDMIMQTISLEDEMVLEKACGGIEVVCDHKDVPSGMRNICYQAAQIYFKKTNLGGGIKVTIKKRIPAGAGLAGGSTNAAAVIKGLDRLYDTRLTPAQMAAIGLQCGADVPFCLAGGTCRAQGIGEKLTRLPSFANVYAVLIMPDFSVSTEWVYKNYRMEAPVKRPNTELLISAIRYREVAKAAQNMVNVLESVTVVKHPQIEEMKQKLKGNGALGSLMSGSGPSVFGLFENEGKARNAFLEIKRQYPQVYFVHTTDGGKEDGEIV